MPDRLIGVVGPTGAVFRRVFVYVARGLPYEH